MVVRGEFTLLMANGFDISSKAIHFPPEFGYGPNDYSLRVFICSYIKLLDDSPLIERDGPKPKSLVWSFYKKLTRENLIGTIKQYAELSHKLFTESYETGGDSTITFLDEFVGTPIFREYHEFFKTRDPRLLQYITTFLLFGKKVAYTDANLDAIAFRNWLEIEDGLRTLTFNLDDLIVLRTIISVLLKDPIIDNLYPAFGPGKVSEIGVRSTHDKLRSLSWHPRLRYIFGRESIFGSSDKGFPHNSVEMSGESSDVARLKFVPKDISKSRSICMEPNSFMYFQQEVLRWLVHTMDRSLISRMVNLRDQTISQSGALHGSTYYSVDTLDLSSASDSVHVDLVRGTFPKPWLYFLLGTRTSKVQLPDGSIRVVTKFAPMGSAVCFPVQCILFTAICVYGYILSHPRGRQEAFQITPSFVRKFLDENVHRSYTDTSPFTRRFEKITVYGDDIICDSRATDNILQLLDRLGFSVNRSKSFTGSHSFRESCGVYAFNGAVITPVRYSVPSLRRNKISGSDYASLIDFCNTLGDNGLYHCRSFVLSLLRSRGFKYPLPFVTNPDSFGIYTLRKHTVDEEFLRWNANWQIYEELVQGIGIRGVRDVSDQHHDYLHSQWWRSRIRGYMPAFIRGSSRIRSQETGLAPIWARCE